MEYNLQKYCHYAEHLELTQYCKKSTILQFLKMEKNSYRVLYLY